MTRKEMNLAVFRREPLPHVFFQPRFEPWFSWTKEFGRLPGELEGKELRDAYDLIGASMRSVHYYTGRPDPVEAHFDPEVKVTEEKDGEDRRVRYDTPHGPLFERYRRTVDHTWRKVEFAGRRAEDLPALLWLIERRTSHFSAAKFRIGADYIGDRGVPQFWVPKSPYFALAQQWMKYEDFIYALVDCPREIEAIMDAIDRSYDRLYEELTSSGLLPILNFGENVAQAYFSIDYYERYCRPWYEKRAGQLRDAGIFTHIHIDGYFRVLLPYLADMPFDGLEALTPEPQGDVTLEEMRDHVGDKIILDGIPAVYFLDHHPREAIEECVEKLTDYFHPRLVLGISDELPQASGAEGFERLKWVAEWCEKHGGG